MTSQVLSTNLFWDSTQSAKEIINNHITLGDNLLIVFVTFIVAIFLGIFIERTIYYVKKHKKEVQEDLKLELTKIESKLSGALSPEQRQELLAKREELKGKIK